MRLLKIFLFGLTFSASMFIFSGGEAEAAVTFSSASTSPSGYRTKCTAGTPVDFAAFASNVHLNVATGVITYNINVEWGGCSATPNRAYAIYGSPDVCPLAGWYAANGGEAYDCVKYIGSPAYSEPGNSLTCNWGTNSACVTPVFAGARVTENSPPIWQNRNKVIPMSHTIPGWGLRSFSSGSYNVSSSMCQYYKTGSSFQFHNDNRCQNISINVSWTVNADPTGNIDNADCNEIYGWAYDADAPNTHVTLHLYFDEVGPNGRGIVIGPPGSSAPYKYELVNRPDVPSGHKKGFRIPKSVVERYRDAYTHKIYLYAININSAGQPSGTNIRLPGDVDIGRCALPQCDPDIDFSPSNPEAGAPYTASAGFTYDVGPAGLAVNYDMTLTVDSASQRRVGWSSNGIIPWWVTPPSSRSNKPSFGSFTSSTPGTKSWNLNGFTTATLNTNIPNFNCGDSYSIYYKPYLKIYANDVFAGGDFDTDLDGVGCTAVKESDIFAWQSSRPLNNGSNSSVPTGSSVEYAAYALGQIDEFGSAGLRRGDAPPTSDYRGLIFGNFEGSGKQIIGDHPSQGRCIPNYMTRFDDSSALGSGSGTRTVDVDSLSSGAYYYDYSRVNLSGTTLSAGKSITVYVKGDVNINGNISMANYNNISDIPTLHIVTDGNVNITSGVTDVDAVIVSQGTVKTCTNAAGVTPAEQFLFDFCNRKLTINGAVIANDVDFKRTNGTMSQATDNEPSSSGTIAEVFNFLPEIYLSQPEGWESERQKAGTKYDYIISLPPIL